MSSNQEKKIINDKLQNSPENYQLYCALLKTIFENINYYISKKNQYYQEIIDKTKKHLEKIQNDYGLNADKYFPLIAKSLVVQNYKLGKNVLIGLKDLIKNNFLIGDTLLSKFNIEFPSFPDKENSNENDNNSEKKIIDLIVESLASIDLVFFDDDDIWYYALECLDELVNNKNITGNIKGNTFKKIYVFYLRIFEKFEGEEEKQKSIKEKLSYLINSSIDELKIYLNSNSTIFDKTTNYNSNNTNSNTNNTNNNINNNSEQKNDVKENNINFIYSNKNYLMNIYNKLNSFECIENNRLSYYNPIDLFICRQVRNMVDIICIRSAKGELITTHRKSNINNSILPIVPKKGCDFSKISKDYLLNNDIYNDLYNEYSFPCGFFGWCYFCRKPANHYCIDFRLPLCSYVCKDILFLEDDQLNNLKSNLVKDCPKMFKFICQILSNKNNSVNQKILALDLISNTLKNYGAELLNYQKNFIKVVKEDLSEGLFKTCLSTEPNIFIPSISLFFDVWKIFRENLKREINFFNVNVFLKLLSSTNSSFMQKKIILENFSKCDFLYFMELYANYDCKLNERFTVSSIVKAFSEIVKGRYSRSIQSFSEQENYELVNLALKTLTSMFQSLFEKCEKEHQLNKNTYKTISSSNSINSNIGTNNNNNINSDNDLIYQNQKKGLISEDDSTSPNISSNSLEINKDINQKINSNLKKKYELQTAAEKFNYKIKSGISYLKKNGFINSSSIDTEAKDIMLFFRNTPSLKKSNIGEFLGENTELSIKTLKYYAESFDFKGVHMIQALRIFLSTFQLPSEGQKIDRVLTSFASKFYNDNENIFINADSAFYLAYAIMILQTELHNPNIKEKMSMESFMKMCQDYGIISSEYLEDIYKQIQEEPLSLTELEEEREKITQDKEEEKFAREKQRIVNEYNYNTKMSKNKDIPYIKLKDEEISDYLSQFMSSIWTPLVTMYSIVIEESDDPTLYNQAIAGVSNCIKIFGLMGINTKKETVVSFLCVMTNLLQIKPLKKKSLLCIKEILLLANSDYRYCKGCWNQILDIINKLYYYNLLNSMPKDEREEIFNIKRQASANNHNPNNQKMIEELIELEKEIMKKITKEFTPTEYEKIFSKTLYFDVNSLIEFIKSICEVAKKEFRGNGITKIFFLQKIVEVAEMNLLCRPRFNINVIWKILSDFFVEIGISDNIENSTTSIDSLRQLITKFLQKNETKDFRDQANLLKPFYEISKKCQDPLNQEYIICCINNLVRSSTTKIKTGWATVLNIFEEIFKINDSSNLKTQILDTMSYVAKNYFNEIVDIFDLFCKHLMLYGNKFPEEVMNILESFVMKISKEKNYNILLSCYPIFILHTNDKIRSQSLANFSDCINKRLKTIKSNLNELAKNEFFWKNLINAILLDTVNSLVNKIIGFKTNNNNNGTCNSLLVTNTNTNNNSTAATNNNINITTTLDNTIMDSTNVIIEREKFSNTLESLLIKIGNLFNEYFGGNFKELPSFFSSLEKIIFSEDDKVQNTGLECVRFLHGSDKMNNMLFLHPFTLFLISLAQKSLEKDLLEMDEKSLKNLTKKKKSINIIDKNISYCYIHCNIISLIDKLLMQYMKVLPYEDLNKILDCLESSIIISNQFNTKIELRFTIMEYDGIASTPMANKIVSISSNGFINLFKQFQISIKNFYYILDFLFFNDPIKENRIIYFRRIMDNSVSLITDYVNKYNEFSFLFKQKEMGDIKCKEKEALLYNFISPLCDYIFPSIQRIEFYNDEKYRDILSGLLFELILCQEQRIRKSIKDLLTIIFTKVMKNK